MLTPLFFGLLGGGGSPPAFTGYNADYLTGVTNLPWTPAAPENVSGGPAVWTVSPPLPSGLSINPVTGEIYGTPTVIASSMHTVYATNTGGQASQSITFNITADTFVEWTTPGSYTWYMPNGVSTAYVRAIICSGGGGGGSYGAVGDSDPTGGGGGGSGRHFTNFDWRYFSGLTPGMATDVVVGSGGNGGNAFSDSGVDGTYSLLDIGQGLFTPFIIAGGGGGTGSSTSDPYPVPGGLAGGGNHGLAGYDATNSGDMDPGFIKEGGMGAEGVQYPFYYDTYPTPPGYGTRGRNSWVYWTSSPNFSSWDISPATSLRGGGGGGGSRAQSDFGEINDLTLHSGADGGDGYVRLDWNPALNPTEYWVDF